MPKTKTIAKLKQDTQKIFNLYIRCRDEGKPCISCGKVTKLQAGHFHPVSTYDSLRFHEDNVHGECEYDNNWNTGHLITYQENLIARIGLDRFNALRDAAREYKRSGYKWTREELIQIKQKYSAKIKEL